jgi:hypothetical protein
VNGNLFKYIEAMVAAESTGEYDCTVANNNLSSGGTSRDIYILIYGSGLNTGGIGSLWYCDYLSYFQIYFVDLTEHRI